MTSAKMKTIDHAKMRYFDDLHNFLVVRGAGRKLADNGQEDGTCRVT